MSWILAFTFSMVLEGSTSRVKVLPMRVSTKICILLESFSAESKPKTTKKTLSYWKVILRLLLSERCRVMVNIVDKRSQVGTFCRTRSEQLSSLSQHSNKSPADDIMTITILKMGG